MLDAEVAVIGVGSMGSMVTWQLAKQGVSVIGFEQFGIGHDRGAAGGDTRVFRTAYSEGANYVPILLEALKQWRALEAETNKRLLTITKGLMGQKEESDGLKNILQSIKDYKLDYEVLTDESLAEKYPQFKRGNDEVIIEDKQAGFIRSQQAILAAVDRARELGAKVYSHTTVERITETADKQAVKIIANEKSYTVGKVVITAGPWMNELLPMFKENLEIRRLVGTWYSSSNMADFHPEKMPVFSRISEGYSYYGIPSIDGAMIKMSFSAREPDVIGSPTKLNRNVTTEEIIDGKYIAENFFAGLYDEPIRTQAYTEGYTTDGHPIIGPVPGQSKMIIGCGFSGHGFKMAAAIGKILADLTIGNEVEFSLTPFSPARFN